MSEERLFQKALALAKAKNYEGAKAILEELDSPNAKELLRRVNLVLSKPADVVPIQSSQAPEIAPKAALPDYSKLSKAKPNRKLTIGISLIVLLIAIGAAVYFLWWLPTDAKLDQIFQEFKLEMLCRDVFADARNRLSADSFTTACEQEAQNALLLYKTEVAYCLDQTQLGRLEVQFVECLIDNGFQFSGVWIGTAR